MNIGDSYIAGEYSRENMTRVNNAVRAYYKYKKLYRKFSTKKVEDKIILIRIE
jgi:hypothetical protein